MQPEMSGLRSRGDNRPALTLWPTAGGAILSRPG